MLRCDMTTGISSILQIQEEAASDLGDGLFCRNFAAVLFPDYLTFLYWIASELPESI